MSSSLLNDLNPAQQEAVKDTEGPSLILAGAGSGKTRALTYKVAYLIKEKKVSPENILMVTFTNKAAEEMKSRILKLLNYPLNPNPLGETASSAYTLPVMGTFHSFCAKVLRKDGHILGLPSGFAIYDETDALDAIKEAMANLSIPTQKTSPSAVRHTISSAKNELLSATEYPQYARGYFQETVAKIYLEYQKILEQNYALDFDDLLLKVIRLFQTDPTILTRYQIQFQYILIDEYQDTNPAQYLIAKYLANRHKNICVVGDASQCLAPDTQISTPGGSKLVKDLKVNDIVIAAAGRGRIHQVPIQKVKVSNFEGKLFVIKTKSGKTLRLTPNHILFARLNLNTNCYYVYLMYRRDKGYRIGLAKGTRITAKDREPSIGLQIRSNQKSADKMWILKVCKDRAEANYWEQWFVVQYGIPSMVFSTGGRSMLITQEQIDELYKSIDTRERAKTLFIDYNLLEEYPHHKPKGVASRLAPDRQIVHLTLFSDKRSTPRSPWSGHRISINTSNESLKKQLKEAGHYTRAGNKNTWRIETSHWNYEAALNLAEKISLDGGNLNINHAAFIVDNKKFLFTPASHIRETMQIGILDNNQIIIDEVISVSTEGYEGKVYDLDIEILHNYCANGVVVHNSIYSFRGADFRNIVNFQKDYPNAKVFNLEQNYRSTQNILDAAHAVISKNKSHPILKLWTDKKGGEKIEIIETNSEMDEAFFIISRLDTKRLSDYAILYRTNAQSRSLEEHFLKSGIPYKLYGGISFYQRKEIKDVLSYLRLFQNPKDTVSLKRAEKIGKQRLNKFMELYIEVSALINNYSSLELLDKALEKTEYLQHLEDGTEEGKNRIENVKELRSVAELFPILTDFLENVSLVESGSMRGRKKDADKNAVTLMTLHSAKGLEFQTVFIVGMEEGLFPHSRTMLNIIELEEERRLMYVGITRAKEKLFLTYTRQRLLFGQRTNNLTSRFLSEIPQDLISTNASLTDIDNKPHSYEDTDDWLN